MGGLLNEIKRKKTIIVLLSQSPRANLISKSIHQA
jgi:hypothetical protein